MRLLEFNKDNAGANPRRAPAPTAAARKPRAKPTAAARNKIRGLTPPGAGKVFPIAGKALIRPARSNPVDLEQLQARIEFLESRLQSEPARTDHHATVDELESLQGRLQRLERDLETELWASRQREHTMLELLNRPPLKVTVRKYIRQLWHSDLPAAARWSRRLLRLWWLDVQPEWWPRLARAWQESLEKARR